MKEYTIGYGWDQILTDLANGEDVLLKVVYPDGGLKKITVGNLSNKVDHHDTATDITEVKAVDPETTNVEVSNTAAGKKVYTVDVGDTPPEKVAEVLQSMKENVDDNGAIIEKIVAAPAVKTFKIEYNTRGEPIKVPVESEELPPVVEENEVTAPVEVVEDDPINYSSRVLVNADTLRKSTAWVKFENSNIAPIVLAEIDANSVVDPISLSSDIAQCTIVVKNADYELPDDVLTTIAKESFKVPERYSDIVVGVRKTEQKEYLDKGIDILGTVQEALETKVPFRTQFKLPVANTPLQETAVNVVVKPSLKPDSPHVTISIPPVLTPIVEANVTSTANVVLNETHSVQENATLTPVVTANGQNDIVVAATPENAEKLKDMNVDVTKDISLAVTVANTPVANSGG